MLREKDNTQQTKKKPFLSKIRMNSFVVVSPVRRLAWSDDNFAKCSMQAGKINAHDACYIDKTSKRTPPSMFNTRADQNQPMSRRRYDSECLWRQRLQWFHKVIAIWKIYPCL